jgi:hypothetical protein
MRMSRRRITVHPQRAHRLCRRYQDREGALAIRLLQLAALLQHLQRNGARRHRKREPTDAGTAPAGEPMPPPSGRVGRPDAPCDCSIIPSCHRARLVVGGQPHGPLRDRVLSIASDRRRSRCARFSPIVLRSMRRSAPPKLPCYRSPLPCRQGRGPATGRRSSAFCDIVEKNSSRRLGHGHLQIVSPS